MTTYNKFSYSLQMPEIAKSIKDYVSNSYDHNWLIKNRFSLVDEFKQEFLEWFSKNPLKFHGLEQFPYFYITNGITEFVQEAIPEHKLRPVSQPDEYPGYHYKAQICIQNGIKLDHKIPVISLPFYSNAEIHPKTNEIISQDSIVDLAWSSNYGKEGSFDLSNSKYVVYSFSKTFGMQYHRIGVCFSKQQIWSMEVYHKNFYVNLAALSIVKNLMKKFEPNYLYDKYRVDFEKICYANNLEPSNSLWFGLKDGVKVPLFELLYDAYYRE
jgi:hypothetical protein